MVNPETLAWVWSLGVLQVLGVASAFLTRMSSGTAAQVACQRLFLGCLGLMGLATAGSLYLGPGHWLLASAVLAMMILVVTCDFGETRVADRS